MTPKTDIGRLKGRIIELMEQLPEFAKFKAFVAHDKSQRLICCRALPQPLKFNITFIEEGETTPRDNAKSYNIELKKTGELNTEDLTKYAPLFSHKRSISFAHYYILDTLMGTLRIKTSIPDGLSRR